MMRRLLTVVSVGLLCGAPTSTSTTTVATTTTLPETTTTVASTEALIKQAVQDYIAAYFACGQAPAQCDPTTFTASQGPSRATVTELVSGMIREGLHFSSDIRGSYVVPETVTQSSPAEATATFCAYDALIVEGPTAPDGMPTVVNDEILSIRYLYRVFLEGTTWRVGEQTEVAELGNTEKCAPPA
jgi:hypothetical protein